MMGNVSFHWQPPTSFPHSLYEIHCTCTCKAQPWVTRRYFSRYYTIPSTWHPRAIIFCYCQLSSVEVYLIQKINVRWMRMLSSPMDGYHWYASSTRGLSVKDLSPLLEWHPLRVRIATMHFSMPCSAWPLSSLLVLTITLLPIPAGRLEISIHAPQ